MGQKAFYILRAISAATLALLATPPVNAAFVQQGTKLVGTGATGTASQGYSVAISRDSTTIAIGGNTDNANAGAVWIFVRSGSTWTQQGTKLVGTGTAGGIPAQQGYSVALSADGNTLAVGGPGDNIAAGGIWIFTRTGSTWAQQGGKLIGGGNLGNAQQGSSVSLSDDGNTLVSGGPADNAGIGAAWVFTRSGSNWTPQMKLIGNNATAGALLGSAVAISGDGNTLVAGGYNDNGGKGASWIFIRNGGTWTQQGNKFVDSFASGNANQGSGVSLSSDGNVMLVGGRTDAAGVGAMWSYRRDGQLWTQTGSKKVGTGFTGNSAQGWSVAVSSDGKNGAVGGPGDNANAGATWTYLGSSGGFFGQIDPKSVGTGATGTASQGTAVALSAEGGTLVIGGPADSAGQGAVWVFTQPVLEITPQTDIAALGPVGGPFVPPYFSYQLKALNGNIDFSVTTLPNWLSATSTAGTVTAGQTITLTFHINSNANALAAGLAGPSPFAIFNNTNNIGSRILNPTLTVGQGGDLTLLSAVLPASRSVKVGGPPATAFATIINTSSTSSALNCALGIGALVPAIFSFQTTNPATNAVTGNPNTGINIPANGSQSFVFAFAPYAPFTTTDVPVVAGCTNSKQAPTVVGLNTLLLSASANPIPDIVALAATPNNDGIVNVPVGGTGVFAVATSNVGIGATITASTDTGTATLPISVGICETNPATGVCISATGPSVSTSIAANGTPTFGVFVAATAAVPFSPAVNRVFVRFSESGGIVRGATSVAVRTQ